MIQFTRNYTDRSNDQGFQLEFHCDKCGAEMAAKAKFCPECGTPRA
jgi:uncharacterized OB-fold protein